VTRDVISLTYGTKNDTNIVFYTTQTLINLYIY